MSGSSTISNRRDMPKMIDREFEVEVASYIKTNIEKTVQFHYQDYLSPVLEKMEKIFQKWWAFVLEQADSNKFSACVVAEVLDKQAAQLMCKKFISNAQLIGDNKLSCLSFMDVEGASSLIGGVLPGGQNYEFLCFWTPTNEFIYPLERRRYQRVESTSLRHLESVQRGGNEGSIVLKSASGESVHFHQIYLDIYTDFFNTPFSTSSPLSHMKYRTESLQYLQNFVYEQKNRSLQNDLEGLLDVLTLSVDLKIPRLQAHLIDVIKAYLFDHDLNREEMTKLLEGAFSYKENEEFLTCCLKKLDRTPSATPNWRQFSSASLLAIRKIATKHSLVSVLNSLLSERVAPDVVLKSASGESVGFCRMNMDKRTNFFKTASPEECASLQGKYKIETLQCLYGFVCGSTAFLTSDDLEIRIELLTLSIHLDIPTLHASIDASIKILLIGSPLQREKMASVLRAVLFQQPLQNLLIDCLKIIKLHRETASFWRAFSPKEIEEIKRVAEENSLGLTFEEREESRSIF